MTSPDKDRKDVETALGVYLNSDVPPEVDAQLRRRLAEFRSRLDTRHAGGVARVIGALRVYAWAWAASIAAAATILTSLCTWQGPGGNLYAIMDAVPGAKTVHFVGHTSSWNDVAYAKEDGSVKAPDFYIDGWLWKTSTGGLLSLIHKGPVTMYDDGQYAYRYDERDGSLRVVGSGGCVSYLDQLFEVVTRADRLKSIGLTRTELGERITGGRTASGTRFEMPDRLRRRKLEFWVDTATNLPIEISGSHRQEGGVELIIDLQFTYGTEVPPVVAAYAPPMEHETTNRALW